MTSFTLDAMHWVGQLIANFVYSRYDDIAPVVKKKLVQLEGELFSQIQHVDAMLAAIPDNEKAAEVATQFSFNTAERLHVTWRDFHGELFATFVDGYTTTVDTSDDVCGCKKHTPHWSAKWKHYIASSTGDRYVWTREDTRTEKLLYNEGQLGVAPSRDVEPYDVKPQLFVIDKLSLASVGGHGRGQSFAISSDQAKASGSDFVPQVAVLASSHPGSALPVLASLPAGFVFPALLVFTNLCSIGIGFWFRSVLPRQPDATLVAPLLA